MIVCTPLPEGDAAEVDGTEPREATANDALEQNEPERLTSNGHGW